MKNLQERAIEAAKKFITRKGYEVIEASWRSENTGSIDLIARDEEMLIFIDVAAHEGIDKGMPEENLPAARERMEINAAKWLAQHVDDESFVDVRVRFDTIGMMVLSENRALLRYHINCLGVDFTG